MFGLKVNNPKVQQLGHVAGFSGSFSTLVLQ